MNPELVLPSSIDWDSIKGRSLEECVYWLLESLGAKDIDWRVGGTGGGAADGGRDIECSFYSSDPSGQFIKHQWWIEVKGSNKTIPSSVVKNSIHNIAGHSNVDVHLIVTNQQISNPTKDWIKNWKISNPRPDIRVWEGHDLERLVSKHPVVAVRLFPKSLSPQGLIAALSSRFWDYSSYSDVPTLETLWKNRESIKWDEKSYFATLASECANGSLSLRPWGVEIPDDRLVAIYLHSLINTFYLFFRAFDAGIRTEPIVDAISHLLILSTAKFNPEIIAKLTENFDEYAEGLPEVGSEARRLIIDPIVNNASAEISSLCLSDCSRVMSIGAEMSDEDIADYLKRYVTPTPMNEELDNEEPESRLYIEQHDGNCKVGLNLSKEYCCPLTDIESKGKPIETTLKALKPIINARTGVKHIPKSDQPDPV